MKKTLILMLTVLLASVISYGQTFQNTNALSYKSTPQRKSLFKKIDSIDNINLATVIPSIQKEPPFILQNSLSKEYLKQAEENASNVELSLKKDASIPESVKELISTSINDINTQTAELREALEEYNKTIEAKEKERLYNRIERMEKYLDSKRKALTSLNVKYANTLNKNKDLATKVQKMTDDLKALNDNLSTKDGELVKYAKIIYKLRLKLNEPDLEGIFRKYTNINTKFIELKSELDSVNWFVGKSLSDSDAVVTTTKFNYLIDKFAGIKSLKYQQVADSTKFSEALKSYRKLDILFEEHLKLEPAEYIKLFNELDKDIDDKYKTAAASLNNLQLAINKFVEEYEAATEQINQILKKYVKEESKEQYYSVFGGFKKILEDEGAFIPEINVFANKKFGNEAWGGYGQIRLYTGSGINNNNFNTKLNYFVSEASSFGIAMDMGLGFSINTSDGKPSKNEAKGFKDIGINTSFYVMGKSLALPDSSTIKPNVALWKTGLEILPFQNFFSLRVNMNGLFTTNRVTEIKEKFTESSEHYWFTDVAFSTLLDIKESKNFKIKFDLNLIFLNKKMKSFLGTDDNVLPQVKLELVTLF